MMMSVRETLNGEQPKMRAFFMDDGGISWHRQNIHVQWVFEWTGSPGCVVLCNFLLWYSIHTSQKWSDGTLCLQVSRSTAKWRSLQHQCQFQESWATVVCYRYISSSSMKSQCYLHLPCKLLISAFKTCRTNVPFGGKTILLGGDFIISDRFCQ